MTKKKILTKNEITEMIDEYDNFDENDIFDEDEDRVRDIKYALTKLDTAEKILFLMQVENQSFRKCAEIIGVSPSTFGKVYKGIKEKIINIINTNKP